MTRLSRPFRVAALGAFALLVAGVGACSDRLDAGSSCPLLCPLEGVPLRDTVLDIVSDTTVLGFPQFGLEDYLLVASRGDTLETRGIIRYDTLFTTYHTAAGDSEVIALDSAFLRLIVPFDSLHKAAAPVTIEVYNVDTQTERLAGVIRSQSSDAVVLVTGPNGEVRIPRSQIKKIQRSNVSLMPEGFDEALNKSQLTDLLEFLQAEKKRP